MRTRRVVGPAAPLRSIGGPLARSAAALAVAALAAALQACSVEHHALRADAPPATPLPAAVAARFDYAREPIRPALEVVEDTPEWEKTRGRFDAPCPVGGKARPVTFEFWRAKAAAGAAAGARLPVIAIVPILAGRYPECDHLGRLMARNGMHAFFVHREDNIIDFGDAADPFETKLRRSVVNIRRALDWVAARPDVDPDRVGLVGISLGAIVGTVVMGVEPRVKRGVLIMGGGDIPGIALDSIETPVRRLKLLKMRANGWTEDQYREWVAKQVESDPLALAPHVGAARVQQFVARYDNKVPTAYQWRLWEALGRPECFDVPIGHYTAIFYLDFAERNALAFMKKGLAPASPSPASKAASTASSR